MTEVALWNLVRPHLSPAVHAFRIENAVGVGMSDVNMCRYGVEVWPELKVFHGNKIYFRPSQIQWIPKRLGAGGRVVILTRRLDAVLLYRGCDIPKMLRAGIAGIDDVKSAGRADPAAVSALAYFQTTKPYDWAGLEEAIFSAN